MILDMQYLNRIENRMEKQSDETETDPRDSVLDADCDGYCSH